jgi:hypothetical protein
MIFEIRNYHFDPELFPAYQKWAADEAIPHLSQHLDVLGFWVTTDDPAEILGRPQDELGVANVTWIIRWDDLEQRNSVLPGLFESPEWADIFSRVPGGMESYQRIEAKFAKALA